MEKNLVLKNKNNVISLLEKKLKNNIIECNIGQVIRQILNVENIKLLKQKEEYAVLNDIERQICRFRLNNYNEDAVYDVLKINIDNTIYEYKIKISNLDININYSKCMFYKNETKYIFRRRENKEIIDIYNQNKYRIGI